jgi:hypothetical protein
MFTKIMINNSLFNLTKKKLKIVKKGKQKILIKNLKVFKKNLKIFTKTGLSNFKFKKKFKKYPLKKISIRRRIKNCLNYKAYHRKFRTKSIYNSLTKKSSYFLHLKICSNNIFCVLREKNKTIKICSSGKYNVKISKKKLRYNIKPVITFFFQEIKKIISLSDTFFLILTAPLRLRKQILKFIFPKIFEDKKQRHFCVKINEKKCFNGCRVKKKKRKKQKKLRLFKE